MHPRGLTHGDEETGEEEGDGGRGDPDAPADRVDEGVGEQHDDERPDAPRHLQRGTRGSGAFPTGVQGPGGSGVKGLRGLGAQRSGGSEVWGLMGPEGAKEFRSLGPRSLGLRGQGA